MEIKIFDYGMNGEGVGKLDGKIVLVENTLNGETVDVDILNDNGNYATAKSTNIIKKSKSRTKPECPYFDQCGGCQLQHMNYSEQLKLKTNHIRKTIKKITGLDINIKDTVPCSTPFHYRNKMSFSIQSFNCGFLKEKSNEIVDIDYCPLADNSINSVFKVFKTYIQNNPCKHIRNLVVRSIQNQILVGIVTKKHIDLTNLLSALSTEFENVGLYEIVNTRKDSVVLSGKVNHIGGIKEIKILHKDSTINLNYSVDLLGFHQTNLQIQEKLYESVLNYICSDSIVINGFSGQGLLTAILAQKAKKVIGIEINKSSHKSAEKLKQKNKISNIFNICGDFFKCFKQEMKQVNTIILDPAKRGCGKNVMNEINGIDNIIYISCNPIALSKDLNVIKDNYIIEEIVPFDMFPNTINLETLVKLKRKNY